jgi:ABC-type Zn uptake system ZnuABC Zn-binding protein ZnuA
MGGGQEGRGREEGLSIWSARAGRRAARAIFRALVTASLLWSAAAEARPAIVATTADLGSLAAAVAGSFADIHVIVPPGLDAEAFEPKPADIALLRDATLIVRVGLGYDSWLDKLLRQIGNPRFARGGPALVDASAGIPLLEVKGRSPTPDDGHAHGLANPHYWLDPANAETITAAIAEGIARVAPEHAAAASADRARFLADLRGRIEAWRARLAAYDGVAVVAYHNSWPYFARRFRINIVAVIEEKEGVAPSPNRLARLVAQAKAAKARVVIRETYEPEDAPRLVASRVGAAVAGLAAGVGAVPEAKDYIALFDYNIAMLLRALGG